MADVIDITGQRFGKLFVIERKSPPTKKDTRAHWLCRCDCGNFAIVSGKNLRNGNTKSCGCVQKEKLRIRNYQSAKHHGRNERLYCVWRSMIGRCKDKNHRSYKDYGGRGIKVCNEWLSYSGFREWALKTGYDPSAKKIEVTIDRIDNDKDYCPENCRWINMLAQENNKRNNAIYEHNGEKHTIAEWARILGMKDSVFRSRVYHGWDFDRIVNTPIKG